MFSCDWTDGLSYKLCSKSVSKLGVMAGVQCGDGDGDGGGDGGGGGVYLPAGLYEQDSHHSVSGWQEVIKT